MTKLGETYQIAKRSCISSIFQETVKNKLKDNFISILCDGTTGSTLIEKECICGLFVDNETYLPTISFFSFSDVPSHEGAIKKCFTDTELEFI